MMNFDGNEILHKHTIKDDGRNSNLYSRYVWNECGDKSCDEFEINYWWIWSGMLTRLNSLKSSKVSTQLRLHN